LNCNAHGPGCPMSVSQTAESPVFQTKAFNFSAFQCPRIIILSPLVKLKFGVCTVGAQIFLGARQQLSPWLSSESYLDALRRFKFAMFCSCQHWLCWLALSLPVTSLAAFLGIKKARSRFDTNSFARLLTCELS
jgi:hypothetical protein